VAVRRDMSNVELLGIGVTVIFGIAALVWGVRAAKKRSQTQTVKGGTGIQSGRDTNVKT
jgi:hypothetical protein